MEQEGACAHDRLRILQDKLNNSFSGRNRVVGSYADALCLSLMTSGMERGTVCAGTDATCWAAAIAAEAPHRHHQSDADEMSGIRRPSYATTSMTACWECAFPISCIGVSFLQRNSTGEEDGTAEKIDWINRDECPKKNCWICNIASGYKDTEVCPYENPDLGKIGNSSAGRSCGLFRRGVNNFGRCRP